MPKIYIDDFGHFGKCDTPNCKEDHMVYISIEMKDGHKACVGCIERSRLAEGEYTIEER